MPKSELVAELREILKDFSSEQLDNLLALLRAESARSADTTSPCPGHLAEE